MAIGAIGKCIVVAFRVWSLLSANAKVLAIHKIQPHLKYVSLRLCYISFCVISLNRSRNLNARKLLEVKQTITNRRDGIYTRINEVCSIMWTWAWIVSCFSLLNFRNESLHNISHFENTSNIYLCKCGNSNRVWTLLFNLSKVSFYVGLFMEQVAAEIVWFSIVCVVNWEMSVKNCTWWKIV